MCLRIFALAYFLTLALLRAIVIPCVRGGRLCEPICIHVLACLFTLVLACASHNVCMCLVCGDAWFVFVFDACLSVCLCLFVCLCVCISVCMCKSMGVQCVCMHVFHSPNHSPTCTHTHTLTPTHPHSPTHPLTPSLLHTHTHPLTHPPTPSPTHSPTDSLIHSLNTHSQTPHHPLTTQSDKIPTTSKSNI